MATWIVDIRIDARHVQCGRMGESRSQAPGVCASKGVGAVTINQFAQYSTDGVIPVFRGRSPSGARVRVFPLMDEDIWEPWASFGRMFEQVGFFWFLLRL